MKKKFLILLVLLISAIMITGCSINISTKEPTRGDGNVNTESEEYTNSNTTIDVSKIKDDISEFDKDADEIEKLVDKAEPKNSRQDNYDAYTKISVKIEDLENKIDRYDDELENMLRDGKLSRSDYKDYEYQLESIEDRLDRFDEKLEYIFGIDD